MKIVLPDSSELELPDGATGLDAARAIGPKLAEQSVLARVNGATRDLRLPLADGESVQFLTTRDAQDPDALWVLRHSTAHLLAEAVMRLHPGVKIAIGPPIADGFYYDFEFPEPISESDLEAIEEEIRREIAEGREWAREELSREEAIARFEADGQPYKVELARDADGAISLYTQGAFTDLCRGPHLQSTAPIKAVKLTSLAGAYWRGDERNTQLTRIYGTAFYSQADLDSHLERLEQARARDHRKLGTQLDLFHFDEHSPGSPFWHPKGMVLWNALEDLRRRENAQARVRRGEDAAHLRHQTSGSLRVTGTSSARTCSSSRRHEGEEPLALKPMNCPGHMLLFGSQLRCYRDLPIRYAEAATLHRNELGGTLHGLTRVKLHHAGRRAHLLTEEQIAAEIDGMHRLRQLPVRPLRRRAPCRALDATGQPVRHRRAVGSRGGGPRGGTPAPRARLRDLAGRGNVLRPQDRPAHDGRPRPELADGDDPVRMQMPQQFGLTYMGADNREQSPVVDPPCAARVVRALPRDPRRALRRRVPVLARAGAGACDPVGEGHRDCRRDPP